MVSSPIWMGNRAKRTAYAVTDHRAIVVSGGFFGSFSVQSFEPDCLTSMQRIQRSDGSGDLIFQQFTRNQGSGATTVRSGFMAIDNVQQVEELIRNTLLAGRTPLL